MRLIFYISLRKDLEALKKFKEIEKAFSGNPYYFFRVFKNLKNKSPEEMLKFFEENREEIKRRLLKRKERIESLWKPIDSKFFREVERITGFPWKFEYYKAHISSVLPGCYEKYRNKISVFAFWRNVIPVIAEELIHLHYWDTLKEIGISERRNREFLWKLSECIPPLIWGEMDLGIKLRKYPSWNSVMGLFRKIKPIWEERKSYREFLLKVCYRKF